MKIFQVFPLNLLVVFTSNFSTGHQQKCLLFVCRLNVQLKLCYLFGSKNERKASENPISLYDVCVCVAFVFPWHHKACAKTHVKAHGSLKLEICSRKDIQAVIVKETVCQATTSHVDCEKWCLELDNGISFGRKFIS